MKKRLHYYATVFCFILLATSTMAQDRQVSGVVRHSVTNEPLIGVSILLKGSATGVTTNAVGAFQITVPNEKSILILKMLGYSTLEYAVQGRNSLSIQMVSENEELEDVVVTALGIKREEKSLGYATQQLKGDELTMTKDQNVLGSLAGKIAGVQVTGSSAASMGGTQKIKIRGVNSITGGGSPLLVIDGTPISNQNFSSSNGNGVDLGNIGQDLNPEDIEDISVLKGPTASALYGIRGQYGVVMITTKKGKKGPKRVDVQLNSSFSTDRVGNFLPLQNIYGVGNNQTFLTLPSGEKYVNGNDESWGPKMDGTPVRMYYSFYPQDSEFGKTTPFLPQPNNIKDFYQTGYNINNGLSVSGGSENSAFRLSYTNAYVNGTIPNTWLKRNNLGFSGSLDVLDNLVVSTNMNYANNNGQRPVQGYQGSFTGAVQWFQRNIDINRLKDYKYPDGTILNWNVNPNTAQEKIVNNKPSDWNNPYFDAYENLNNDKRDRFFGDVGLSYEVLPGLKLSSFIRTDLYTQNISSRLALGGRLDEGYSVGKYQNSENNYEFLGQYDKRWDDLSLNVNVGANIYTSEYSYLSQATVGGLSSPAFYNISGSIDRPITNSYLRKKEIRSQFAMASFGYKDTYFLDASVRRDVSSTLPLNNNSYIYPSVSGSFVFSELIEPSFLSFGKIRASYAIAGSDLSPYQIAQTYSIGSVYTTPGGAINTLFVPDALNNENIKPSYANSFEAGFDLKFLNNRVGLDFTYYNQNNKNQIINLSVSGASGYINQVVNAGLIQNKGIELSLLGAPIRSDKLNWDVMANFAKNTSKIKELHPDIPVLQLDVNSYSSQSVYLNATENAAFGSLVGPGYIRDEATGQVLLGANNMPLFAQKDMGSVLPEFTGGILNNIIIGQFHIGAMIDFQKGGQFFSWSQMLAVKSGQAEQTAAMNENGKNIRDPLADGGGVRINGIYGPGVSQTIDGLATDVSGKPFDGFVDARTYFRNNIGTRIYEEWIYDASFVKLREVSVGYSFSGQILQRTPFKAAKISVIARNPLMIWQKAPKGVDPSELSSGSASISWIEKGELQTVRSFGFNLNLTF